MTWAQCGSFGADVYQRTQLLDSFRRKGLVADDGSRTTLLIRHKSMLRY